MWTKVSVATSGTLSVGVNRRFVRGEPEYSIKIGTLQTGPNGEEYLNPYVQVAGPGLADNLAALAHSAVDAIEEDREELAKAEAARIAALSSAPKSNPLDRKGLKQIGKTAKKKAKAFA